MIQSLTRKTTKKLILRKKLTPNKMMKGTRSRTMKKNDEEDEAETLAMRR